MDLIYGSKINEQAMLKNMAIKTGRSLEEWTKILKIHNLLKKTELIDLLKNKHSVGHFYAQLILKEFYSK